MKSKKVTLSKELALKMYKGCDSQMKAFALENYPEFGMKLTERITSFEDVLEIAGKNPEDYKAKDAEDVAPMALKKLRLVQQVLVEGWKPDWGNSCQYKYYPYFKKASSSGSFSFGGYYYGDANASVGSRLCFPNSELAIFAGKVFINEYNEFLN